MDTDAEMGQVVDFPSGSRRSSAPRDVHDEVYERLATKLAKQKKLTLDDRRVIASKWHEIAINLKKKYNINKAKIYEIFNRYPGEHPKNSEKRAFNYEYPPNLAGDKLDARLQKITKTGEKWRQLIEHAAALTNERPFSILRRLLQGTSLLPSSVPTADIPEPIAAVLNLANAACRSIAAQVELERFYEDWDRNRVSYQYVDDRFLPRSEESPLGDRFVFCGEVFYYYPISEPGGCEERWPARLPLPSACFAKEMLVVAEGCLVDRNSGSEHDVHVEFLREYRLAIGGSGDTPIIEIRPELLIMRKDVNKREYFFPLHNCYVFSSSIEKIREEGYNYMSIGSHKQESKSDQRYYNKILILRELEQGGFESMILKELGDEKFALSFGRHCALLPDEYNDMDASYKQLSVVLEKPASTAEDSFSHFRLEQRADFDSVVVLNEPTSLAGILEYQLLQGTGEGTLYARLLEDARRKVNGFYECYNRVLEEIAERHRHALEQFGAPQKP